MQVPLSQATGAVDHPRERRLSAVPRVAVLLALVLALVACGCSDETAGPPTLGGADPDSGTAGTLVTLTGSNFTSRLAVSFGSLEATSISVISSSTVAVHAPDGLESGQSYTISVRNPGSSEDQLMDEFRAVPPRLQVVNGVSKPSGQLGSTVILEGRAFGDLLGRGSVFFTDDTGAPVEAVVSLEDNWTNDFIVTTVPQAVESGPMWVETATGVSDSVAFRVESAATFSPSQILWTETTTLPAPSQGHRSVFLPNDDLLGVENTIFVAGGADGALLPRSDVWQGAVDDLGQIPSWSATTSLPEPRAFHGMALATPFNALLDTTMAGHIYAIGGIDSTGAPSTTVFRAPVFADRSLGGWTSETSLPQGLHSMGCAVFRSWLYVCGGAGPGNAAVDESYRARIQLDGSLGPWEMEPSLPMPRAYGVLTQFAGVLYMVGGDGGSTAPGSASTTATQSASIYYNRLDLRTGQLQWPGWVLNSSELIKSVAKHSVLVAGGTMLVSGGVYNGAGSSATEHQYATINPDGSVSSFNGATGSHTIVAATGVPFFNHSAITYVDSGGEAHVMILGGNDVQDPTTPTGRNWYY
jgi:hypothetical protein